MAWGFGSGGFKRVICAQRGFVFVLSRSERRLSILSTDPEAVFEAASGTDVAASAWSAMAMLLVVVL
jgi:hypothetical protein